MLAIVISLLFGLVAFAALGQIRASLVEGAYSARRITAQLSAERVSRPTVRRPTRAAAPARLAAA